MKNIWIFTALCVVVHLILLKSVFDIYFVSPVYSGMTPHKSRTAAPAKRVVLFVADGLRSESLYGNHMIDRAPYLHYIIHNVGSWGISHTQVPTESRPGHVAILAGFNEDPSAITRGWKSNPVDFDSVINQSTNAWCWGSPDIVDIFNKDNLSHIHLHSYDAYWQDFSGKASTTLLDTWVFDQVTQLLSSFNREDCKEFCQDGNVFFLHLLGLDTAGHSFTPETPEYLENIRVVDAGIKAIVNMFENFFNDGQTVYIFTSDHGMTNWGSHGDGSDHETHVPFIAWGAGIARISARQDIEQADTASLISSLVGINIPVNNLGIVPLNFLNVTDIRKAHIIHSNALQLSEQYLAKEQDLEQNSLKATYQSYPDLTPTIFNGIRNKLTNLFARKRYRAIIQESYRFIALCKSGLKYYTSYYQNLFLRFVTGGFISWIIYLFTSIDDWGTSFYERCYNVVRYRTGLQRPPLSNEIMVIVFIIMVVFFFACGGPTNYFVYSAFPLLSVAAAYKNYHQMRILRCALAFLSWHELIFAFLSYIIGVELLVVTFFDHKYLGVIFIIFAIQTLTAKRLRDSMNRFWFYVGGYVVLGLCPLVFNLQTEFSYISIILCWFLWFGFEDRTPLIRIFPIDGRILKYQFIMLRFAFLNNLMVHLTITYGVGLYFINQIISWILSAVALIAPVFISDCAQNRIISATIALVTPYTLMAMGYEHIFIFILCQHMFNWFGAEYKRKYNAQHVSAYRTSSVFTNYYTDQNTLRLCFYLLAFIMVSYFGVGNTASMNSFSPLWVRCFVTVFSPFTMAALILIKLIIPFLIVLCTFRGVILVTRQQVNNCFLVILLLCDLMVIQFLFFVKNEGSWLEIGVSLSRFIVVNVTTIVLIVLYQVAYVLTTTPTATAKKILPLKVARFMQRRGLLR